MKPDVPYLTKNIHCIRLLTSIPSLFMIEESIFNMAVLMVLGGGSTVIPMLIALDRFGSSTVISFLAPSTFYKQCQQQPVSPTFDKFKVITAKNAKK